MNKSLTCAVLALQVMLLGGKASAQSTLLNYEYRVVRAAEQIDRIKSDSQYSEEAIPYIKKQLLPKTEAVDLGGRRITVDNTWLWEILDAYSKEQDQQARAAQLNEVAGRLRALDDHLQRAVSGSETGDLEAERARLREILSRGEYQQHEETIIGKYIKKALAMIRDLMVKIREALLRLLESVFGAGTRGAIVPKLIVISAIVIALWWVAFMLRRLKPAKRRKKKRVVLGEDVGADVTPDELANAAMTAARAGDFRSAIRKLYVSLLFELAERQIIELEDSATNREYLKRVSRHAGLVPPMRFLTDRFDFVWYGMVQSSQEDFSNCLSSYHEAIRSAQQLEQQKAGA